MQVQVARIVGKSHQGEALKILRGCLIITYLAGLLVECGIESWKYPMYS